MSNLTVDTLVNQDVQLAKALVNFDGTGVVAIRSSFNVDSITDNGTGDYTVNFTTLFSTDTYISTGLSGLNGSLLRYASNTPLTTSGASYTTLSTALALTDAPNVTLSFFEA